jgi:GT2 family glycosyltransferase
MTQSSMSTAMPELSIVIVNYNTRELLRQCLDSIESSNPSASTEIIVVDNASQDGSAELVRSGFPNAVLIASETNVGFARGNNLGIRKARGRYILLLNSDTIVLPGSLDALVDYLKQKPFVHAVGPMLINEDGSIQRSWFDFPSLAKTFSHIIGTTRLIYRVARRGRMGRWLARLGFEPAFLRDSCETASEVDYLIFACVLVRADVFRKIGLLDEDLFFYHEDFEFGYRMRLNGLHFHYLPATRVVHLGGGTAGRYVLQTYRANFVSLMHVYAKHYGYMKTFLLRSVLVTGFLWRSLGWLVGGYRTVRKVGAYEQSDKNESGTPQDSTKVLATYLGIIKDSMRGRKSM